MEGHCHKQCQLSQRAWDAGSSREERVSLCGTRGRGLGTLGTTQVKTYKYILLKKLRNSLYILITPYGPLRDAGTAS